MKMKILLIAVLLMIVQKSDAQFFQELFGKAKEEFNSMLQKNATRLTQQGLEFLGNQAERINIVSSKKRTDNASANSFIDNPNQSVTTNQTEAYLKKNYPNFFKIYSEVIQDPYINQILFVFREKKDWVVQCRNGVIMFDLNQFNQENGKSDENQKCWALLIMQGLAHQEKEKPNLIGENAEYERFYYALVKARNYAENGNCCALKRALNYWKNRDYSSDSYKEAARNKLIKTEYYVNCELWFKSSNCDNSN